MKATFQSLLITLMLGISFVYASPIAQPPAPAPAAEPAPAPEARQLGDLLHQAFDILAPGQPQPAARQIDELTGPLSGLGQRDELAALPALGQREDVRRVDELSALSGALGQRDDLAALSALGQRDELAALLALVQDGSVAY